MLGIKSVRLPNESETETVILLRLPIKRSKDVTMPQDSNITAISSHYPCKNDIMLFIHLKMNRKTARSSNGSLAEASTTHTALTFCPLERSSHHQSDLDVRSVINLYQSDQVLSTLSLKCIKIGLTTGACDSATCRNIFHSPCQCQWAVGGNPFRFHRDEQP